MEKINYTELLKRLKNVDRDAFALLYEHTRERLFAYVLFIVKDEAAAQDIVQDLFIDFWEQRLFLNIQSGLVAYLMTAARNRAIDHIKKQAAQHKFKQDFDYFRGDKILSELKIDNEELSRGIKDALTRLPPMPAKVFQLHYIDKLSHAQIAEQLKISRSTISNHMDRALKILRAELKKQNNQGG